MDESELSSHLYLDYTLNREHSTLLIKNQLYVLQRAEKLHAEAVQIIAYMIHKIQIKDGVYVLLVQITGVTVMTINITVFLIHTLING